MNQKGRWEGFVKVPQQKLGERESREEKSIQKTFQIVRLTNNPLVLSLPLSLCVLRC